MWHFTLMLTWLAVQVRVYYVIYRDFKRGERASCPPPGAPSVPRRRSSEVRVP